jgi:hypothetical protein
MGSLSLDHGSRLVCRGGMLLASLGLYILPFSLLAQGYVILTKYCLQDSLALILSPFRAD